jgi:hypothetical protein
MTSFSGGPDLVDRSRGPFGVYLLMFVGNRLITTNAMTMSDFVHGLPDDLFTSGPAAISSLSSDLRAILKRCAFTVIADDAPLVPLAIVADFKQRLHGAVERDMLSYFSGCSAIP